MSAPLSDVWADKRIVVLSGGIGGARLVHGLERVLPPNVLRVIVNTGDDFEHLGVWVSPDCDTIMYTLAGMAPVERGWGIEGDTYHAMENAIQLGAPTWFQLGDRDLGTNLLRTARLRQGDSLSSITEDFCRAHGLQARILPMADSPHPTFLRDDSGTVHSFQDWLVKERGAPIVERVELRGTHEPTTAVLEELEVADVIILPPSNPFVSIDPILALKGVRELVAKKAVVGVAPIIHGAAVKGPLAAMIPSLLGEPASAAAVGRYYEDLLDLYLVAAGDEDATLAVPQIGCDVMMRGIEGRERLARELLTLAATHLPPAEERTACIS